MSAEHLPANSGLKPQEYSDPILGRILLGFAEVRFTAQRCKLEKAGASSSVDEPAAYHTEGILSLPAEGRFDYLLNCPERVKERLNRWATTIRRCPVRLTCSPRKTNCRWSKRKEQ